MSHSNAELRSKRKFQWFNGYVITPGVEEVLGDKCKQENNICLDGPMWLAVSSNGKQIAKILEEHASLEGCEIIECPKFEHITIEEFYNKMEGLEAILNNNAYSRNGIIGVYKFFNDFAERVITKHKIEGVDIYVTSYIKPHTDCIIARETTIMRDFEF